MRILAALAILCISNYTFAMSKIALGSCNKQDLPQPLWPVLLDNNPDLFIWLGDNIYADTKHTSVMKKKYEQQKSNENYKQFTQEVPIIGIWDDHDFGKNNIGRKYSNKVASQKLFLDFMNEPKDSVRRKQVGIYTSYNYVIQNKKIKFILLDTRYFRDKPNKKGSDILGLKQWAWLKNELQGDADLLFIASGYSVLSPSIPFSEEWADFPYAKTKLFKLLEDTYYADKTVFLTGDRHFSAILQKKYRGEKYTELMVSGLTHSSASKSIRKLMKKIYGKSNIYVGRNAGLIEFLPSKNNTVFKFKILNEFNETVLGRVFRY